ncbi:MAG TPA: hypothetical protein VMF31_13120 [Solirubrobacterales bacterium]|nr:hypothetical protein [Solirubrobacterales bacterium]
MKRILICLAFGFGLVAAVPGSAQAAAWASCGPVAALDESTNHVWVSNGECEKAVGTVRSFYRSYIEFFEQFDELTEGDGGISMSVGRFDCDFDPEASPTILRCENDPMLVLGLRAAGSDPNKWATPPVVTRTLTRNQAKGVVRASLTMDEDIKAKEKLRISCARRLSRLSFRCGFSWFDAGLHFRGSARVTKQLRGYSSVYSSREYDRKCLREGGTLRKCELREKGSRSTYSRFSPA